MLDGCHLLTSSELKCKFLDTNLDRGEKKVFKNINICDGDELQLLSVLMKHRQPPSISPAKSEYCYWCISFGLKPSGLTNTISVAVDLMLLLSSSKAAFPL